MACCHRYTPHWTKQYPAPPTTSPEHLPERTEPRAQTYHAGYLPYNPRRAPRGACLARAFAEFITELRQRVGLRGVRGLGLHHFEVLNEATPGALRIELSRRHQLAPASLDGNFAINKPAMEQYRAECMFLSQA